VPFDIPPDAPQPGGGTLLSTGDNRLLQTAAQGDVLWGTHATLCTVGSVTQSCARVVRVGVGQTTAGELTASLTQQSTLAGRSGSYLHHPGIAVTSSEALVVPVLQSSPTSFLSTFVATRSPGAQRFRGLSLTAGTCNQASNRTGDYLGAQTAPDLASVWVVGERATTIAGECQWETQVGQITLP
jgi:hypothetical protein